MLRPNGDAAVRGRVMRALEAGEACWCPIIRWELWNGAGGIGKKRSSGILNGGCRNLRSTMPSGAPPVTSLSARVLPASRSRPPTSWSRPVHDIMTSCLNTPIRISAASQRFSAHPRVGSRVPAKAAQMRPARPQQCFTLAPLPQAQRSLRPSFGVLRRTGVTSGMRTGPDGAGVSACASRSAFRRR